MNEGDQVRVLFVHGLESHPNGSKVRLLREQGLAVTAPDMHMGLWKLERTNSALRQLFRLPEVWMAAVGVAVGFAAVGPSAVAFLGCAAGAGLWWASRRRALFAAALGRSFDASVEIQRAALQAALRPDVVVGSSWGGAVVAELIRRGEWSGPTVLLAPAIHAVGTWTGRGAAETVAALRARSAEVPIVVFHDPTDTTVPHADSVALAHDSQITLRSVDAGGHRLLALLQSGALADTIRRLAAG